MVTRDWEGEGNSWKREGGEPVRNAVGQRNEFGALSHNEMTAVQSNIVYFMKI